LGTALEGLNAGTISPEPSYPIFREVQYGFTIQNKTSDILKGGEFWTYGPVKLNSTQRCNKLEVSHPYQIIRDDLGNQILYFQFANLPPHGIEIIIIKASLGVSDMPNPLAINDARPFLTPEKYIESDHPELQQMARKFASANPRETTEKIFRWVADNISYAGYLRDSRGALYALRNRRGDCTEYMSLFAALCRANKIPARGIGGYVCREDSILKPDSYHNWAEFYEAGAWRIGDPQKRVFRERASDYIAMRIIGESSKNPMGEFNRFRSSGIGLEVKMMN
jgi:transglutaminase-like putative cysteine protease